MYDNEQQYVRCEDQTQNQAKTMFFNMPNNDISKAV